MPILSSFRWQTRPLEQPAKEVAFRLSPLQLLIAGSVYLDANFAIAPVLLLACALGILEEGGKRRHLG